MMSINIKNKFLSTISFLQRRASISVQRRCQGRLLIQTIAFFHIKFIGKKIDQISCFLNQASTVNVLKILIIKLNFQYICSIKNFSIKSRYIKKNSIETKCYEKLVSWSILMTQVSVIVEVKCLDRGDQHSKLKRKFSCGFFLRETKYNFRNTKLYISRESY